MTILNQFGSNWFRIGVYVWQWYVKHRFSPSKRLFRTNLVRIGSESAIIIDIGMWNIVFHLLNDYSEPIWFELVQNRHLCDIVICKTSFVTFYMTTPNQFGSNWFRIGNNNWHWYIKHRFSHSKWLFWTNSVRIGSESAFMCDSDMSNIVLHLLNDYSEPIWFELVQNRQ